MLLLTAHFAPVGAALTTARAVVRSAGAYTFTVSRANAGQAQTAAWSVAGSSLNGVPAIAADFGGVFPSGTITFAPGETTKTITVTPSTNAEPE